MSEKNDKVVDYSKGVKEVPKGKINEKTEKKLEQLEDELIGHYKDLRAKSRDEWFKGFSTGYITGVVGCVAGLVIGYAMTRR